MSVGDIVIAVATFLLLCASLSCYTLFQSYFFSREPTQRTVINSLVVNLSFLLEVIDIYPNDSNISRANYFFLRPLARELFEILKCANLIEGANYY